MEILYVLRQTCYVRSYNKKVKAEGYKVLQSFSRKVSFGSSFSESPSQSQFHHIKNKVADAMPTVFGQKVKRWDLNLAAVFSPNFSHFR